MTSSPAIRRATPEDASELARLLTPLGYPVSEADVLAIWPSWEEGGNWALVLPENGRLLGSVTLHRMTVLHRPRPVGRITSLIVDPAARGQGWGRALVDAAEQSLMSHGCGMVEVTSHQRRKLAHEFYLHLDYERTSYRFAKTFPGS